MKLYAQHGYAPSDKIREAAIRGIIDGAILSPRYLKPDAMSKFIEDLRSIKADFEILIDPEYYATRYVGMPNCQLGYLEEWPHFMPKRMRGLLVGNDEIDLIIRTSYESQKAMGCSYLIAPNVYVSDSLDSIEAAIAIKFISRAQIVAGEMKIDLPIHATISLGKNAIIDKRNFESFLNEVTAIEPRPDGIYSLVGAGPSDERVGTVKSEILVSEVIAGWMLLNYSLSLNGFAVVNGCSDILTPWLGVSGAVAGATGWWSYLQVFAMGKYIRSSGGGQRPIVRYLSNPLLNRIKVNEREAIAEVIPEIMNGLSTDTLYERKEPSRSDEALQSWEALASLNDRVVTEDLQEGLEALIKRTEAAKKLYDKLSAHGFSERYESNLEYLAALENSVITFKAMAEL